MYNILVCDDERDIVAALEIYLKADNYSVHKAYSGKEALDTIRANQIHLVLLDIMMPQMDGIQTLTALREFSNVPVILLTAKGEDTDKVLGLTVGADDYITKPFNPVELQARVRSQIRRYMQLGSGTAREDLYLAGGIALNDKTKEVTLDGEPISLTKIEYKLLHFFMQNPNEPFSPRQIYQKVWNDEPYGTERTVAVHIRHLREKLEYDPSNPRYLVAVWGQGYKLLTDSKKG